MYMIVCHFVLIWIVKTNGSLYNTLWPDGIVPYILDQRLDHQQISSFETSIKDFMQRTTIKFIRLKTANQIPHLRIFSSYFKCATTIGFNPYRIVHILGLKRNISVGMVIHEILHSLGFVHEDQRMDRPFDLRIHRIHENFFSLFLVQRPDRKSNFVIQCLLTPDLCGSNFTYDLCSIMHHGPYEYTNENKETFTIKSGQNKEKCKIGQRENLTLLDIEKVRTFYPESLTFLKGKKKVLWMKWFFLKVQLLKILRTEKDFVTNEIYPVKCNESNCGFYI